MKKINKKKKGFTLIELLVVIGLISILGTMIGVYVINSSRQSANIRKDYEALSEARIALSYVTNLIRENDKDGAIIIYETDATSAAGTIGKQLTIKDKVEVSFEEGKLKEKAIGVAGASRFEIASVSSFQIAFLKDENGNKTNEISIKVGYKKDSDLTESFLQENITKRCLN